MNELIPLEEVGKLVKLAIHNMCIQKRDALILGCLTFDGVNLELAEQVVDAVLGITEMEFQMPNGCIVRFNVKKACDWNETN